MNWKRVSVFSGAGSLLAAMLILKVSGGSTSPVNVVGPFDRHVTEQIQKLKASSSDVRSRAAEALGYLRAYGAADALQNTLGDKSANVRRAAALALAWCGGRPQVETLLKTLDDADWSVSQAAAVALNNLTGHDPHFDAMAEPETRRRQAAQWTEWWAAASKQSTPHEILAMLKDVNLETQLRGVRALGAVAEPDVSADILAVLKPYLVKKYDSLNDTEKHLSQACMLSLGRLRAPGTLSVLTGLLEDASWARYAADALGDFGSGKAVKPMLAAYARFSRPLDGPGRPKLCPADDCVAGDATLDRMYETPYAIAQALVRLPFDDSEDLAALRNSAPFILANVPADWDGGMLYVPETHSQITAYLLDKAGLRETACEAAFQAAAGPEHLFSAEALTALDKARNANRKKMGQSGAGRIESAPEQNPREGILKAAARAQGDAPMMATWLPGFCNDRRYTPQLISLLEHENGWLRINAAKALMFADAKEAIEPLARILAASHSEAEYGFSGAAEHEEYADPAPRWRESFIRALGRLQAKEHDKLLIRILEDDRNVVEIRHAAAEALDELGTPKSLDALRRAESGHPLYSVRLVAREALWRRGMIDPDKNADRPNPPSPAAAPVIANGSAFPPKAYVFIRGENKTRSDFNDQSGVDPWRETYTVNNPSPAPRMGRNLFTLSVQGDKKIVKPLTNFEAGYVSDCEVSWDARKVVFAYRRNNDSRNYAQVPYTAAKLRTAEEIRLDGKDDPWWHIWEINADGTGLRQITHGPYHDAGPVYLPDGRIVFTSTRLGLRDEYHGFAATGLAVMNPNGTDIRVIGQNLGGDRDPAVLDDGRIVFSRLDVFYSRLKAEVTIQAAYPDGTKNVVLYGPERRAFWMDTYDKYSAWTQRDAYGGATDNRNRVLRMSQAQPLGDGRLVAVTSAGLVVVGPGTAEERLVPHDRKYAVTSPFPIGNGKVVAAASEMQFQMGDHIMVAGSPEFAKLDKGLGKGADLFHHVVNIDLGLYVIDLETGAMEPLYNDPKFAEFEARPLAARTPPSQAVDGVKTWSGSYTAKLFAASVFNSRHERVRTRGKILRVIEGQPFVSRNETQENPANNLNTRWKNHAGTHARILATVPLAADGSFYVEVPADRLLQLQVLDSDRRVLGNQTFWMYARPGETKGCAGCHESPDMSVSAPRDVMALKKAPLPAVPKGDEYTYRAKTWIKGMLPDEIEERSRTVRAVSLMGRQ